MTSNLASEVIADHAVQLREEAQRVEKKQDINCDAEEDSEQIEISRKFKDEVVYINFFIKYFLKTKN